MSGRAVHLLGRASAALRRSGLGGALRVGRDAADRLLLTIARPPLRVEAEGVSVRGFLRHRSFLDELAGGYEELARSLFLEALADADVVLDIGAHLGFYSVLAARRNPAARVVAVEADPYNAAALAANVRRLGLRIEIVAKAVAERSGRATFQQNLGTVGSSLVARPGTGPVRVLEIETTTVDEVVGTGRVGRLLAKIDVEGAERRALAGMHATLERAESATLLVEVNPRALAAAGTSAAELVSDLEALRCDVAYVDEALGSVVPVGTDVPKGNLLARRRQ